MIKLFCVAGFGLHSGALSGTDDLVAACACLDLRWQWIERGADTMAVMIRVLGTLEISANDEPIEVRRGRVRAFTIVLASRMGERTSAEVVADHLWSYNDLPKDPTATIQSIASRFRGLFKGHDVAGETLIGPPDGYRLNPDVITTDIDLWDQARTSMQQALAEQRFDDAWTAFEQAEQLWRGTPFDGFDFEGRLHAIVRHLQNQRAELAMSAVTLAAERDRQVLAETVLESVLDHDPSRDDALVERLGLLQELGRATIAIDLAAARTSELASRGIEAPPSLMAAEVALLNHQPVDCRLPQSREAIRIQLSALLDNGHNREWEGQPEQADDLFNTVIRKAAPAEMFDHVAQAALAGWGRSGRIGGKQDRRNRLNMADRKLPPDHPERDAITAELAYEVLCESEPLPDTTRAEVTRIAAGPASPGSLLARRLLLIIDQNLGNNDLESARTLVDDAMALRGGATAHVRCACLVPAIGVATRGGAWRLADSWITELGRIGSDERIPRADWQHRAMSLAIDRLRRAVDAEDDNAVRDVGQRFRLDDADATHFLARMATAFANDTMDAEPVASEIEFVVDLSNNDERYRFPIFHAWHGLVKLSKGDRPAASVELARALNDIGAEHDMFADALLAPTSLLAARLNDRAALADLEVRLNQRADKWIFVGYGGPGLGPVNFYRGAVAAALGRHEEATALFEAAERKAIRLGADAWRNWPLRHHVTAFASTSSPPPPAQRASAQ